jgi:NADPH:quinone reductase-like Zn-dependent oxidoreductase
VPKPAPKDDQVSIRVRAAAVNPLDWRVMRGKPYLIRLFAGRGKHKIPGRDVAGEVEALGRSVKQLEPGDLVFGTCSAALAEYACASESAVAIKPNNLTFEQAAAVGVAGLTALQGLRDKGRIRAGQKVLINGASGGVGTFAVQIAKTFGADVTGVCSTRNVEMVRSLGADRVTDYTQQDFTKGDQRYDLILDNVGNHSFTECRRVLNPHGRCVVVGGPKDFKVLPTLASALFAFALSLFDSRKNVGFIARGSKEDLTILSDLMATGKVTPVIDRTYPLSETFEALRYLEVGHARGKVVITIPPPETT